MNTTASIFQQDRRIGDGTLALGSICLWQDGLPPVPYASIKDACQAAKRNGWNLTRLPPEGHVPDGYYDLEDEAWALVERLMAK